MIETILTAVLDPAWNARHRLTIWLAIVGVLFISGFGLPLPEDIPLMVSGFTTFKQGHDAFVWWRFLLNFAIVTATILLGDLLAYSLGRRYGMTLRERVGFFGRMLPDKRLTKVRHWFDEYGGFTIFLARQLAGVRFVTFYTAGTIRMNVGRFVFWDFLGALVSVPMWLTIGALAARYGRVWMHAISTRVGRYAMLSAVIVTLLFILFVKLRPRKADESEVSAAGPVEPEG